MTTPVDADQLAAELAACRNRIADQDAEITALRVDVAFWSRRYDDAQRIVNAAVDVLLGR